MLKHLTARRVTADTHSFIIPQNTAGMWIMNKEQLIKFINKYSELCSSIDIDDLKEDKYVLSFVYWD